MEYLEKALAETYAQLRVNGFSALPTGVRFPVLNGYVTISELCTEGAAVGTILIGTQLFYVRFIAGTDGERK